MLARFMSSNLITDRRTLLARLSLVLGAAWAGGATAFAQAPGEPAVGGSDPLPLEPVAPGIFVYRAPYELVTQANQGAIANMTLIVGSEAAAVIDTGNSALAGARMLAAARATTDRPLRYVINTHMHPDHTLGNAAFVAPGVQFVAHHKMPRALSVRSETYLGQAQRLLGPLADGTRIVLPELLVEDRLTLDLGGRALELRAHPTAHTDNDLTVRDTATGTWVMGDLLFIGHIPTLDGSLNGWLSLLDRLGGESSPRVIPGHGPASAPWPAGDDDERRYLGRLRADVQALIDSGGAMSAAPERAAQSERGSWALFDEFNARNAIAAFHELEWQ
ncbi:quinoprotein relay system zinc metallohydrolase 2 [Ancylobacter sp. SL191]|uniref:quinoprotein relay system zinc metallohydrolase 2 n=1 Tax=Ancylobacter sp. SL191 TaxID=2995166 RepID=UPI00226DEEAD|nr:quinoprotein relay system zinc metallohydrolase 2 [Ancylobacter sp. SL191]WAC26976.1 quinoprotein relay system zinc metallohydrolase 2 [Ancylobacter sp. SL191]